ncbi:MAG: helix-turn-helix transcriptional regulator [Parabacteroides sp.]|jgi:transcriptional regulator with XRE-family HTH domain|nr:helix-turn-helix transcriptional regulator [Parabacteroides sp.]
MIAKNIRMLRDKYNFTQVQIASYLNITSSAVNQYESGVRPVPADVVSKLAVLFNVDEYDLYEEDPQQQNLMTAFAFRADELTDEDIKSVSAFRKIVTNYFHLSNALSNE